MQFNTANNTIPNTLGILRIAVAFIADIMNKIIINTNSKRMVSG